MEDDSKCNFTKAQGMVERKNEQTKVLYLQCNRSGIYRAQRNGKRLPKGSGSLIIHFLLYNCDSVIETYFIPYFIH